MTKSKPLFRIEDADIASEDMRVLFIGDGENVLIGVAKKRSVHKIRERHFDTWSVEYNPTVFFGNQVFALPKELTRLHALAAIINAFLGVAFGSERAVEIAIASAIRNAK